MLLAQSLQQPGQLRLAAQIQEPGGQAGADTLVVAGVEPEHVLGADSAASSRRPRSPEGVARPSGLAPTAGSRSPQKGPILPPERIREPTAPAPGGDGCWVQFRASLRVTACGQRPGIPWPSRP